eukprot:8309295-Pyramimonas_sp.AAC.2
MGERFGTGFRRDPNVQCTSGNRQVFYWLVYRRVFVLWAFDSSAHWIQVNVNCHCHSSPAHQAGEGHGLAGPPREIEAGELRVLADLLAVDHADEAAPH